jgi:hypothetical protein
MICYRDMTFCPFYQNCQKSETCHRPLLEDVRLKAREWWGSDNAPIAVFGEKPTCHTDNQTQEP